MGKRKQIIVAKQSEAKKKRKKTRKYIICKPQAATN